MSDPGSDLPVGEYVVPSGELVWSFSTSGGPGGQHANRSQTRVDLRFDISSSRAFPEVVRHRLIERLGRDQVSISVDTSRSQWRNRALARRRLVGLLEPALAPPTPRRPTRPGRAARKRRLEEKRARATKKRLRRRPDPE